MSFGNIIPDSVQLHYSLSTASVRLRDSLNSYRSLYPQMFRRVVPNLAVQWNPVLFVIIGVLPAFLFMPLIGAASIKMFGGGLQQHRAIVEAEARTLVRAGDVLWKHFFTFYAFFTVMVLYGGIWFSVTQGKFYLI